MAAGLRAGAAGIPHMLGQGCHPSRPSVPVWTPYPPLFLLSSHRAAIAEEKGANIAFRPLMAPPVPLKWNIFPWGEAGSIYSIYYITSAVGVGAGWPELWAAPWERLKRDCVTGKGCEEHRANAVTLRVMLEAKRPCLQKDLRIRIGKHSFSYSCNSVVRRYEQSEKIWWINLHLWILNSVSIYSYFSLCWGGICFECMCAPSAGPPRYQCCHVNWIALGPALLALPHNRFLLDHELMQRIWWAKCPQLTGISDFLG